MIFYFILFSCNINFFIYLFYFTIFLLLLQYFCMPQLIPSKTCNYVKISCNLAMRVCTVQEDPFNIILLSLYCYYYFVVAQSGYQHLICLISSPFLYFSFRLNMYFCLYICCEVYASFASSGAVNLYNNMIQAVSFIIITWCSSLFYYN